MRVAQAKLLPHQVLKGEALDRFLTENKLVRRLDRIVAEGRDVVAGPGFQWDGVRVQGPAKKEKRRGEGKKKR